MDHVFSSFGNFFEDGSQQSRLHLFQTSKYHSFASKQSPVPFYPPSWRLSWLSEFPQLPLARLPVKWKCLRVVLSLSILHKAAHFPVAPSSLCPSHNTQWECLLIGRWWAVCGVNRFTVSLDSVTHHVLLPIRARQAVDRVPNQEKDA